jgi:hypothetical protein
LLTSAPVLAFWMTPIALDNAAADRSWEAAKVISVATAGFARLTSFHNNLPHDTTNDFIMSGVAAALDKDSIQAIAAWLSSLTPAKSL